ncbi:cysteine proteinase [Sistotremastrum suecicum HHB10207 ss-3]|uniref:ubiquitinyl hydrolase 1 n=1 Tax=Sistotremastrum suecicum HHB10207 ss-3 TaxID=1314776 RepID=A0A165ZNY7_9AGAM|nr:cysteine proteinase [Sistotremastrum suecicum HHB10207 ss-3]
MHDTLVAVWEELSLTSPELVLQITVLLVLVVAFFATSSYSLDPLLWQVRMIFQNLGLGLWNWGSSDHKSDSSNESRKLRKKKARTRVEQLGKPHVNGNGNDAGFSYEALYYPGLVNMSGTFCFLNSTLQAMASLAYLQPYIEVIHAKAEEYDVPTPVIDALRDALHALNTPQTSPNALRPVALVKALSSPRGGKGAPSALLSGREQQDAQELFQLLSELVKEEAGEVEKEMTKDRGLGSLAALANPGQLSQSIFDGLTANRRSCVECGYTEAVMHFPFNNLQLAVPRMMACNLEDCLEDYTRLELLNDCICRKCSLLETHRRLKAEVERMEHASNGELSASKKKRIREVKKLESRVRSALEDGRIEEDIKGVKIEKVVSRCSSKQSMIGRPPPVLALHLNRSIHYGHYAGKNPCHVRFPEVLDLTPFTTSGQLSTQPNSPISSSPNALHRTTTPTPSNSSNPRTLYRLSSVVCHFGAHSYGHYVCYRRRPRPPSAGHRRLLRPRLAHNLHCNCDLCMTVGPIRDEDEKGQYEGPGVWLRASDDSVEEVPIQRVLSETSGTFMLFYERVLPPPPQQQPAVRTLYTTPSSSEETVKPEASEVIVVGAPVKKEEGDDVVLPHVVQFTPEPDPLQIHESDIPTSLVRQRSGPRVVRSTQPRSRSTSATPEGPTKPIRPLPIPPQQPQFRPQSPPRTTSPRPTVATNGHMHIDQKSTPSSNPRTPNSQQGNHGRTSSPDIPATPQHIRPLPQPPLGPSSVGLRA